MPAPEAGISGLAIAISTQLRMPIPDRPLRPANTKYPTRGQPFESWPRLSIAHSKSTGDRKRIRRRPLATDRGKLELPFQPALVCGQRSGQMQKSDFAHRPQGDGQTPGPMCKI